MSRGNRYLPVPVVLAMALLASNSAFAFSGCLDAFSATYPASQTDDAYPANQGCPICHQSSGFNFNAYGESVLATAAAQGVGSVCSAANLGPILEAIEALDSDGEGNSNIVEIDAGTQPGWCVAETAGCNNAGTPPLSNEFLDPASPAPPMNNPPMADAGGPYSGEAGSTLIQFDGSGSSDPDGDSITFEWEFGDGNTATGAMPTHTYAQAGNYEVRLVVDDGQARSDPSLTSAAISAPPVNLAPIADPGGPYSGESGQAITFDGSASADPNGDALTYSWDFGDGATGTGVMPTHSYTAAGVYEVSLVVNDGEFDSAAVTTRVEVVDTVAGQPDDPTLYDTQCGSCHGDPWAGAAVEDALPGLRRVGGARSCNIAGSIYGTSVFPNGVPEMQFLQGLTEAEIDGIAEYLNARETSGEQRYVTTCAGCHGNDGSGGRTREDVHGDSASEILEAIYDEKEMAYLACMPRSDIDAIAGFLARHDDDFDDDGIDDDEDMDDDGDGIPDDVDHDDDNDGRSDDDEIEDGTDPRNDDTDDDGVSDGDEHDHGTNPRDKDTDDDDLDDGEERDHGTDPNDRDTDDDGKTDGEEVKILGTDPLVAESVSSDDSSGGGGTTGLPLLLMLLAVLRRRSHR